MSIDTVDGKASPADRWVRAAVACLVTLLLLPALARTAPGEGTLQGNPFRGRRLLTDKLCTQCHSVWGHGGLVGPDLSTAVAGKSWLELVGDFWNHTPRMIDAMAKKGHAWPTLDQSEMADLLSYLYYLRLFDDPGDANRGSVAYSQFKCGTCHSLGGLGGKQGGRLDDYSRYPSPVVLAQAMWNSGPAMQQAQIGFGTAIPTFVGGEMADIQAYIRSQGLRKDRDVKLLPLPDPDRGAAVFQAKRCVTCHRPGGGGGGPDLRSSALHLTVAEISGVLWNHSYAMSASMRARGIPFPRFRETEMADLISYLHFLGFFTVRGDPTVGASVFEQRGCAQCHAGPEATAPQLSASDTIADPIALSAAMWNHAPEMYELMAEEAVAWPTFDPGDMEHLAAYLRRISREEGSGR